MVATLMELMEKSDTDDVDDHVHAMVYIWLKYFFSSLNFTEFGFCPKTLKKKKNCCLKFSHKINIMNTKIEPNSCLNLLPCCWDTHFLVLLPDFLIKLQTNKSKNIFSHIHQIWTWIFMYCQFTKVEIFLEKGNW